MKRPPDFANLRIWLTTLSLALAGLPVPTPACSPMSISPADALQPPGPTARFARIVLAEVIAARAPQRSAELERWRADVKAVAADQQLQDARDAAQARIDAATPRGPDDPPPPPPESRLLEPVLPLAIELRTELDLFVLETLHGPHQDRLSVPAGGPCGSQPRLGEQVLAFIRPDGIAHLLQRAGDSGPQTFNDAFLEQVRHCARGDCPQAVR